MALILTEAEKRIYSNAFSEIKLKKKYHSPFRPDPSPSFEFFVNNKSKRLWWKDWGTGETGNCHDFMDRWTGEIKPKALSVIEKEKKPPPEIIHKDIWNFKLWDDLSIKKETLDLFNVKQVASVNGFTHNRSYIYFIKDGRYRVYTPGSHIKFWGTMDKFDVFGIDQLPEKGKLLVITKSLKDVMVLYEMGIPAIAFASENITPSKKLINELKERFKKVVILYDNDKAGIKHAERIGTTYDIERIYMDTAKDISDVVIKTNFRKAEKELWEKLLKNEKNKTKYDFVNTLQAT